jgi:hypothetical protein
LKEKEKNVMEISEINCIYYNYRVARGWSYSFEIKKEGSDYFLCAEFEDPENSYKPTNLIWGKKEHEKIIKVFFDRIIKIIENNDVLFWDGFDEYDPQAKDGRGFNLRIDFENDAHLTAQGDNSFPLRYSEVNREFYVLINEIIEIYHEIKK